MDARFKMPELISVTEFLDETKEDFNSPLTSTFVSRIPQCRNTVTQIEEKLDVDRESLTKMKKAVKQMHQNGSNLVESEFSLSKALEKLGSLSHGMQNPETDLEEAFAKFAVVTRELSGLKKTLMQNLQNMILFPLESLLKGDIKGVKGDLRRPFDKGIKDYETRHSKLEKEKKAQARDAGMYRKEITSAEIADETERERRLLQLNMCEYLMKVNEIKTKKGVELLKHLVEYYHALNSYFQDGLKTVDHFGTYVSELSTSLTKMRQKQDDERRRLTEVKNLLRTAPVLEKELSNTTGSSNTSSGYSLHQLQGNKSVGVTKVGYLNKKSEGKMRRVWQKRKCTVQDGFLQIFHGDENKHPSRVNLLTCQLKVVSDDRKFFDLVSYNRTYHLHSEDDAEEWISVLLNSKEAAMAKAFDQKVDNDGIVELTQAILGHVHRLPGNDRCADCNSEKEVTWLSVNLGVIVCIECSGVHRTLGVGVSRIQSISLDRIPPSLLILSASLGNDAINEILEETLIPNCKPHPSASMEERADFIRAKYLDKEFVARTSDDEERISRNLESAIHTKDLLLLVRCWAQGAKLGLPLSSNDNGETGLHIAVVTSSLQIIDFLIQNSGGCEKKARTGDTPLHYCAMYGQTEAAKLLLRSGVDLQIQNNEKFTALDVARNKGHKVVEDLLLHAMEGKKTLFETVDFDWNLGAEDSTDFSDEETAYPDDSTITPEKKRRPNSFFVDKESPYRSSNDLRSGSGVTTPGSGTSIGSQYSLKNMRMKRVAPPPPSPSSNHTRSPSDSLIGKFTQLGRLVLPAGDPPTLKKTYSPHVSSPPVQGSPISSSANNNATKRPIIPGTVSTQISVSSPAAAPSPSLQNGSSGRESLVSSKYKTCRALYDCEADNEDEISFKQGDIISIINEKTEDDNWMQGVVISDGIRQQGMFPVSFVEFCD